MAPIDAGQLIGPAGEVVARERVPPFPFPGLPGPMPGIVVVVVGMDVGDPGMVVMDELGVVVIDGMLPALLGLPVEPFIAGIVPAG